MKKYPPVYKIHLNAGKNCFKSLSFFSDVIFNRTFLCRQSATQLFALFVPVFVAMDYDFFLPTKSMLDMFDALLTSIKSSHHSNFISTYFKLACAVFVCFVLLHVYVCFCACIYKVWEGSLIMHCH